MSVNIQHTPPPSPPPPNTKGKKRTEDAAQEARADADQGEEEGVLARPDGVARREGVAHGGLCVLLCCMVRMD